MTLCAVCKRKSRGFGWFNPLLKIMDPRIEKTRRKFCSMRCLDLWAAHMKREGFLMIDPTREEKKAIEAVLQPLGECVTEIGMHLPLQDYTRDQVLTLIEVVVTAYQDYLLAHFPDNPPPVKKKPHA